MKHEKETQLSMAEAEEKVTTTLKEHGFGILTRIDVQAKLKEKLGEDTEPYIILGACNPGLAKQALDRNSDIGYLLPCNVIIYEKGETRYIGAVLPTELLSMVGGDAEDVAQDAESKLIQAIEEV